MVDGRVITGKPVLWACARHLEDLEHGEKRAGLWFDESLADRIVRFFAQLAFVEGERAGEPFVLEPWQEFCLGSVFGWMNQDGVRRFRESWIRIGRGNGKSTMGAGVGLYCTGWDGHYHGGAWKQEHRAQCFTAATKLKQARVIHASAMDQVQKHSKYLKDRMITRRDRIIHPETSSYFEPLGRDSKTEDGLNPVLALFDEVHAYGGRGMWDVMTSAMVKRRQPLIFAITTAGYGGPTSFGVQQDEHYKRTLDPKAGQRNDSAFVYIAELDPEVRCGLCKGGGTAADGKRCARCEGRGYNGDDWRDEDNWIKANPNLGVSVYVEGLRERVEQAIMNRQQEPDVRVKNMNQWQQEGQRAIPMDTWDACAAACPVPPREELRRRPCFMGLDLASNRDLNALELYFPICGPWRYAVVLSYFWLAEETVRARREKIDYSPWIDSGEIEITPGEFVDQEVIRRKCNELAKIFTIRKLGADRKFGEKLLPELEKDGFEVVRVAQSFANICPAWQKLEELVGRQQLAHGDNQVLRWCAGNVVLARDFDGLEIPSKMKSSEKIDGIMALANAIHLAQTTPYEAPRSAPISHPLSRNKPGGKRSIYQVFK